MLEGEDFDYHCHSNLIRAVALHALTEFDVHDVLNVFQCTGLNDRDEYFMKTCPAQQGDHFEFFAEFRPARGAVDVSRRGPLRADVR